MAGKHCSHSFENGGGELLVKEFISKVCLNPFLTRIGGIMITSFFV